MTVTNESLQQRNDELTNEVRGLKRQNKLLLAMLECDPGNSPLVVEQGNGELEATELAGGVLHRFAEAFYEQLTASGAASYIGAVFKHPDNGELLMATVERVKGETILNQLGRFKAEVKSLKARLEEYQGNI